MKQEQISGTITDAQSGETLPGVNILVKGTTTGASTDAEGNFELTVSSLQDTLVVSFVGYQTQEVPVNGRTVINISLQTETISGEEMVVVGYGEQRAETLTGSVARTGEADLQRSPAISVSNSLAGLLPGLTTLNRSGEPGEDEASVLIRGQGTTGNTSPLVVVDGVQNPSGWRQISPNDIEQISVLKDASAAIYGARAANGVILITTKRGSIGKPTINYTFNQGISQPTRLPELAGSGLYAEFVNQTLISQNQDPRYTEEEIQKFRDGSDPNYVNADWFGETMKDYSLQSKHHLSLRGGTEEIRYSVSGSYSNQNSIFENGLHNFDGYTIRSNINAQVNENIEFTLDVNAGLDDRTSPAAPDAWQWLWAEPTMPVYYSNGLPSPGIEQGLNPGVFVTDASGNSNDKDKRFSAKAGFDITIPWVQGLGVDGYFVYSSDESLEKYWETPWTVYSYDSANDEYIPQRGSRITQPTLTQETGSTNERFLNLRITYENQLNDNHYVNSFIGVEQSQGEGISYEAIREDYISDLIPELFAGDPGTQENDGSSGEFARQSVIGRVSYNFQEKYLVDFNARYDGSHIFPEGNRFGFFPGVSAAWRLDKEDFLSGNESINELKLRASIGEIGNDAVPAYQYLSSYTLGIDQGYHFGLPTESSLGASPAVTPNPNITWETVTITNLGLDGSFWEGKLGFSVDVFKERRENILTRRNLEVPAYTALSLPNENIGIVENKGIEFVLSHRNSASAESDISYFVSGNVAFVRNDVIDISEAQDVPDYQKAEGRILGAGLYYDAIGIFRTQEEVESNPVYIGTEVGDLQYRDVNGDGTIDAADRVRMNKSNIPEITFGFNMRAGYKNFSLYANFAGQGKASQFIYQNAVLNRNALEDLLEHRYTPGSMDSKYPRLPSGFSPGSSPSGLRSDFWLQNAAFLRLKTAELSYNIPDALLSKAGVSSARVYLSGVNLFTLTKMDWFDPEGDDEDGDFYPQNKIFNLGIDISF